MHDADALAQWLATQHQLNKLYAHDFKNPISAITANLSYVQAMADQFDDDLREAIADSEIATRSLLHLISNFLLISHMEAGDIQEPVAVPLDVFVQDAVTYCGRLFPEGDLPLVAPAVCPRTMCSWPLDIARCGLVNAMLTAVHHSGGTPVSVDVTLVEEDRVAFRVIDGGPPVAEEYAARCFERDFQPEAKKNENARYGRALALYAVGLAAKTLGGTARMAPHPSGGNALTLTYATSS